MSQSGELVIFAPDGIGEIGEGDDLATMIVEAVAGHPAGPLRSGDIVVVTSKVVSKAEGRRLPATQKQEALRGETLRTVARRGEVRIVVNRLGITQAAAGIDGSNVDSDTILLLPTDPDASAARIRAALDDLTGCHVGVVVSDTSGRAWRQGQSDHAIGLAGVPAVLDYAGQVDGWGNRLAVTQMAVADELAAAADLVKGKLAGRPVAVVRGLTFDAPAQTARELVRPAAADFFRLGTREAVIEAVLAARGEPDRFEEVAALDGDELIAALIAGLSDELSGFVRRMLAQA